MYLEMNTISGQIMSVLEAVLNRLHGFLLIILRNGHVLFNGKFGVRIPPATNPILMESVSSLAAKIRSRQLASVQVLKAFIDRVNEINPIVNCVIDERFANALADAKAVDELIASEKFSTEKLAKEKPLLGVPFSTKGSISVKGLRFTSGLISRKDIQSEKDADAIAILRKAGAIPFVSTNVSECCLWWESHNHLFGQTSNVYDTNRTSGGSSGGEASVVAAAASPFGIGSDVGGSIRIPAFFNGIFGHKPSKLIVPADGQYPNPTNIHLHSLSSVGPLCRYASDLKTVLKVLTMESKEQLNLDQPVDLKKIRFFYQANIGGGLFISEVEGDIQAALNKVVEHLRSTTSVTQVAVPLQNSFNILLTTLNSHCSTALSVRVTNFEGEINVWWELLKCLFRQSNYTFSILVSIVAEKFAAKRGTKRFEQIATEREDLAQQFHEMLGNDGVFLYPTHPTVAPYHHESYARALNFSYTAIFNVLGLPVTAIPLGFGSEGLPVGIQVAAGLHQDRLTLAVASELERVFGGYTL